MPLSQIHPIVRAWFETRFERPTDAQAQGWPAIGRGRHTLIAAPTGSGKTLAAFLICIDRLVRAGLDGDLPSRTEVVYVSPLKALSNDIQRNLKQPMAEIAELGERMGTPLPEIRIAVRTGDTPAAERQAMARRPPHILITTPESLYILLTSESGRRMLAGVRTLILDELHAVVGNKRGSHLALSVERLCHLADGPVTRIGLSATQRPIEEVGRFLVGAARQTEDGTPDCEIVDTGHAREVDLAIVVPGRELGPIATHEIMGETLDQISDLVKAHRTTLVFVNTRRLVERVAHQLEERLGEEAVAAHHGSLSRRHRHATEQLLKSGGLSVCVATASLELGIDIGAIDLVCQVGSPRSIAILIQRIGRSGHTLGGTPKGQLFPWTRDELVECTALLRAVRRGQLDRLIIPPWPLDVLAQQIAAACASEDWDEEGQYQLARRAYPYSDLPRKKFDQVVDMLSDGVSGRHGRAGVRIHRDSVNGVLRGRRGTRLAALTSGGAIPDNADYDVLAEPEGTFVGTVNEDFAIESMAGDVFLLGNSPWRIRRVEAGKVRVEEAHGATPTIPFWLGEAPARTRELSDELSDLRSDISERLDDPDGAKTWLREEMGVAEDVADQVIDYFVEGVHVLGMVPTRHRIVAERFFDETGGMQLVIHSPLGGRINRAWGHALRKRICRTFDFELQAAATDDGINLSLGPQQSFPVSDIFTYLKSRTVAEVLTQAVFQAPLFGSRWRWNATRSLAVLRHTGGRRVPPPLVRMRAEDLLAAVFPAQVACQDNALPGDIEAPDHPLVFETLRDCLTDALDVDGLEQVLTAIEGGEVQVFGRDTTQPSVFAHQILNANPYAFLDDAPLEERRARAVALRRALPEDARDLGKLDAQAIRNAAVDAWPVCRDAEELHDALLTLALIPEADAYPRSGDSSQDEWRGWFDHLARQGRATRFYSPSGGLVAWVAAETSAVAAEAYGGGRLETELARLSKSQGILSQEEAVADIVGRRVECVGPFPAAEMGRCLALPLSIVGVALARLEAEGLVLRGLFRPHIDEEEFCSWRILARIHRATIERLRREVAPVSAEAFVRFLLRWQHVSGASRLNGEDGLLECVEQLQGFEAAAGAWESEILPARVSSYGSTHLDNLCYAGEIVWGRMARRSVQGNGTIARAGLLRSNPVSLGLRADLPWLLDNVEVDDLQLTGPAMEVYAFLSSNGASFLPEILKGTGALPSQIEDALWQLVAAGLVTADGFGALRNLVSGVRRKVRRAARFRRRRRPAATSRWTLLRAASTSDDVVESRGMQLLLRYGIVFPELLAREPMAPTWRALLRVYRRSEARGEIRGGRFVSGFVGEQFAMPEAVEVLRAVRKAGPRGELTRLSACDPMNLAGILTPGPRVPAVLGNHLIFRDGVLLASIQGERLVERANVDDATLVAVRRMLRSDAMVPGPAVALSQPRDSGMDPAEIKT